MKRHTNIIITAVASLLIVTLAGREFIKNHKKESDDKSSTNVSENTCEDILDTKYLTQVYLTQVYLYVCS